MRERTLSDLRGTWPAQLASFLFVGGVTFACYFLLLAFLNEILALRYPIAVAIAYAVAVAFHFLANRLVTFRASAVPARKQLGKYVMLGLFNYVVQVAILGLTYDLLGWNFYLGAFLGILVTTSMGFVLLRTWVFRVPATREATNMDRDT